MEVREGGTTTSEMQCHKDMVSSRTGGKSETCHRVQNAVYEGHQT